MLPLRAERGPVGTISLAPPGPWTPPTQVDEYKLIRLLGRGAMGEVFLAHDTLLERRVAIKFIAGDQPSRERRRHILAEARAIARLQHPNVIAVHRVGEIERRPYLVCEYVAGSCLADLPMPMPAPQVLDLALGLARGLAAAHRQRVLHRDIKPHNVLVSDETGEAKLVDFGLAKMAVDSDAPEMTSGTPMYLAPELFRSEPATPRTDVYAMGVLMFQLLAGRTPHLATRMDALAFGVTHEDAPLLTTLRPDVDPRLAAVVARALSRAPAHRYADGDALREAIDALRPRGGAVRGQALQGEPYRGLSAFRSEHRGVFFGRDSEARAIAERLRSEPLVVVAGDSGVGKSSLCHAGVAPRLESGELGDQRRWTTVSFTPGSSPLVGLATGLGTVIDETPENLELDLSTDPGAVARALRAAQGRHGGLLVVVDQLEELVTMSDPETASMFMASLVEIAPLVPGLRVLATVRTDFISRLATLPGLGDQLGRVLHILRPLGDAAIREAIVGPARAHEYTYAPEALEVLEGAARAQGSLPLLQFALAEIWERRDQALHTIPLAAVQASGGVAGALARHADGVLSALSSPRRDAARTLLLDLVSAARTRLRKRAPELMLVGADTRFALDALVRGRLLTTTEIDGETAYELAHEALIEGWSTLRAWIDDDDDARVARERLHNAAREWDRLGRSDELLWRERQLAELERVALAVTGERELAFVQTSRAAARRRLLTRRATLLAIPLAVVLAAGGLRLVAARSLDRQVAAQLAAAAGPVQAAEQGQAQLLALRSAAFAAFDAGERETGEARWSEARARAHDVEKSYAAATQALEVALSLDPTRADVRAAFARTLYARALAAEADHRTDAHEELVQRLALYDDDRSLRAQLAAPGHLHLESDPPSARVHIVAAHAPADGAPPARSAEPLTFGLTPLDVDLEPGSYVAILSHPGHAEVRLPFVVARGERLALAAALPAQVPEGFVYVPAGRFLYGSDEDESLRKQFYDTVPLHTRALGAYFVRRHETTFAEWIAFLEALPAEQRALRMPRVAARGFNGTLELSPPSGERTRWQIHFQPTSTAYSALAGQPIQYGKRAERAQQDWLRFPVSGVSFDDAQAYARWLDSSGAVPGARLCTEQEWERAARGADARRYPHGDTLAPADANFDETHGKDPLGFGPDEVGSHPASASPFGVMDMAGNVWEWTTSQETGVARGGAYYHDRLAAGSTNRLTPESSLRDLTLGLRVCASAH